MVIFFVGCCGCVGFFCICSSPHSYEYMKIRVRLMRTEEDVNENREHFVHVGARLASLSRGWGGRVFRLLRSRVWRGDSLCRFVYVLRRKLPRMRCCLSLRLCGWGGILFVVLHFRVGGNIYTRTSFVSLYLCCYCWRYFLTRRLG